MDSQPMMVIELWKSAVNKGKNCDFENGFTPPKNGGAEGARTPDPHNAIVVLYQLSYDPIPSPDTLNG